MIVIYAEKADVGNKIAAALGGFDLDGKHINFKNRAANEDAIKNLQRKQGYLDTTFKGRPCRVTWGYGHLYALCDVPEYEPSYKTWRTRPRCYIPEQFKLHPVTGVGPFGKTLDRQRAIVKDLLGKADLVINATDYDREGELIFAYVCEASGYHKPFKRVLFTSQTETGIRSAFDNLIPSSEVKGIEAAGRARSIYDWLVGTNLTTQMTLRYPKQGVLSIGRVQTPVLKMVVDREEAIRNFVPKVSWNIKGTFFVGTEKYPGVCKGKGEWTKTEADKIVDSITGHKGCVTKLERKKMKRSVPLLYSQTSLQIDASKYFGYTAKQTLDAAQYLYEQGFTSYPRTKSQYLTDDMEADVIKTLNVLAKERDYAKYLTGRAIKPAAKFFDSSKVISHYAIIPTGELPTGLTGVNKNIYDLIVWSLIRTIYPDAIVEQTSVVTTVDKYDFTSSGTTVVEAGWMTVNFNTTETFLPNIVKGAYYPGKYEGKETKTEPPKRYDDGSLIKAMKTAGRDLSDVEFRAILADPNVEGIGTDATRAEIIETLLRRGYVERKGKSFAATEKGISLIHAIPVPEMMSAESTAAMEQALTKIENNELDYAAFMKRVFKQVETWCDIVATAAIVPFTSAPVDPASSGSRSTTRSTTPGTGTKTTASKAPEAERRSSASLVCPVCGGEVVKKARGWFCANEKCDFRIFNEMLSHKFKDKEIAALLKKGETDVIEDFVSKKTGKRFSAKLKLDDKHQIKFEF